MPLTCPAPSFRIQWVLSLLVLACSGSPPSPAEAPFPEPDVPEPSLNLASIPSASAIGSVTTTVALHPDDLRVDGVPVAPLPIADPKRACARLIDRLSEKRLQAEALGERTGDPAGPELQRVVLAVDLGTRPSDLRLALGGIDAAGFGSVWWASEPEDFGPGQLGVSVAWSGEAGGESSSSEAGPGSAAHLSIGPDLALAPEAVADAATALGDAPQLVLRAGAGWSPCQP